MRLEHYVKRRWLCAHPEKGARVAKSLQERCLGEKYDLPVALMPLMFHRREWELLQSTSETLCSILEKTIDALVASPRVRQYLSYEEIPKQWLEVVPGYKRHVIFSCLEGVFNGKFLKFIEFNMDNPSPYASEDIVRRIIATHPFYQSLISFPEKEVSPTIHEKLLEAVQTIYKEVKPTSTSKPTIAFLDNKEPPYALDIRLTIDFFNKQGMQAFVADPKDFKLENGISQVGGKRVDIVYRSVRAQDFIEQGTKVENFTKGYLDHSFAMINSFRAVYGNEKSLFSLLSNPDFHHLYTEEEIQVIKNHIPWTRMLSELETQLPSEKKVKLEEFIKTHRKHLVIKPSWGQGGKNVFLGMNIEQPEWDKVVSEHIGNKDWIVQEYVPIPTIAMPTLLEEKVVMENKYFNVSPWVIHGKFAGAICRLSSTPIIAIQAGGAVLPVLHY
jgi:glutathionylspermidine synthase